MVTGNKNKFLEAKNALNTEIEMRELDIPEIQGTHTEIVSDKAKKAFEILQEPCFVEDTALCFEEWGGMPGPYIKDFEKAIGIDHLPSKVRNKNAIAQTMIGYADKNGAQVFVGETKGILVESGGHGRFGWDRIFVPEGHNTRYSEMSIDEKEKVSQRGKALKIFSSYLSSVNS